MNRPKMILVRRERHRGGAEAFVQRLATALGSIGSVEIWNAGDHPEGTIRLRGSQGPSWWRAILFAHSVNRAIRNHPDAVVISFERGVRADVFRLGDGVHREWVRIKYRSHPRRFLNPLNFVYPRLEAQSIRRSRRIVANSRIVLEQARDLYPIFSYKMDMIENGYDDSVHTPSPLPGDPIGHPRFLFAGHGWARKGLDPAIRILAQIPGGHLTVCGRGDRSQWGRLLAETGTAGRIDFAGPVPELRPFLRRSHAFILPTRYDPFSNACLEALGSGRAVITTTSNGISHRIDPAINGFVIPRDGHAEGVPGWWARTGSRLDPSVIAASVSDLTASRELARWAALIHTLTSPG